jgi:hypothetical protein
LACENIQPQVPMSAHYIKLDQQPNAQQGNNINFPTGCKKTNALNTRHWKKRLNFFKHRIHFHVGKCNLIPDKLGNNAQRNDSGVVIYFLLTVF